ncbi:MAG TPA: hypothetical protein VIJ27_03090 [Mucilaginibacter sp.]
MEICLKVLDIITLAIQFFGAYLMYKNSPENQPKLPTMLGGDYDVITYKVQNRRLKNGFLILSFGILLSLISLIIKDLFVSTYL